MEFFASARRALPEDKLEDSAMPMDDSEVTKGTFHAQRSGVGGSRVSEDNGGTGRSCVDES